MLYYSGSLTSFCGSTFCWFGLNGNLFSSSTNLNHTDWRQGTKPKTCLEYASIPCLLPQQLGSFLRRWCHGATGRSIGWGIFVGFFLFFRADSVEKEAVPQTKTVWSEELQDFFLLFLTWFYMLHHVFSRLFIGQ